MMKTEDLVAWQAAMKLTYDSAAKALGISRATYARYIAGSSIHFHIGLACAAIANGIAPWTEDLIAWQSTMKLTYDSAAKALGISRATYARYIAGSSISLHIGLACAAIANGIAPWTEEK